MQESNLESPSNNKDTVAEGGSSGRRQQNPDQERQIPNNEDTTMQGGASRNPIVETLRLSFLRCVVAASILILGFVAYGVAWATKNPDWLVERAVPGLALTLFTLVHHVVTAFVTLTDERMKRTAFKVVALLDFLFTALESGCYITVVVHITGFLRTGRLDQRWFPQFALLAETGLWLLTIAIVLFALLKLICLLDFNFLYRSRERPRSKGNKTQSSLLRSLKGPAAALFGRRMWEESVPGESKWLSITRGSLALISVCVLVAYGIYQAVILPISEIGMTPHRTYSTPGLSWSLTQRVATSPDLEFKVLLVWARHEDATLSILHSVNATARWKQRANEPVELPPAVTCNVSPTPLKGVDARVWDVGIVECPQSPYRGAPGALVNPFSIFPNFDITVDYTGLLGIPGRAYADRVSDSVRVYLGATADVDEIYRTTEPVSLFPGTGMLSVAKLVLRQRLNPATLATLGFESQRNFLVAPIIQTVPDPFAGTPTGPNIATLGFTLQTDMNEWHVIQDYRSKSVLAGLSLLGGLGNTMTTLLILLLGTSLMRTLFGSKPSSPFGFLHSLFGRFQAEMVDKCDAKYPQLRSEIVGYERDKDSGGVVKYLLDTLIDVETLGYGKQWLDASAEGQNHGRSGGNHGSSADDIEKGNTAQQEHTAMR